METLNDFKEFVSKKQAERFIYQRDLANLQKINVEMKKELDTINSARYILAEVNKLTQRKFIDFVETLVTLAISSIFDRPFKFKVEFDLKRNKSECFLTIQEGDSEPFIPKDEMGGGMLDTISFALRVVLWSLQNPRSSNTILLDEPFKFVGQDEFLDRAGQMLKEISDRLGIQFLITTHQTKLAEIADRAWKVTHDGKYSTVTQISGFERKLLRREK